MTKKDDSTGIDDTDITLRDIMNHISHLHGELVTKIDEVDDRLSKKIDRNSELIAQNSTAIKELEEKLTTRIDALEEDLTATMEDSYMIKKHVGIPVVAE